MDSCAARSIDQPWKNSIDPCFQHMIQGDKRGILLGRTNIPSSALERKKKTGIKRSFRYGFTLATQTIDFNPQHSI